MSDLLSEVRRGYVAATAVCAAIGMTMLSMVSPALSSSADFSIFNTGWNGTSDLAVSTYRAGKFLPSFELRSTGGEANFILFGLEDVELDPASEALAIIGPTRAFSAAEGAFVGEFVRAGGALLLADDFGLANTLLEGMGASCRFSGKLVIDLSFEKSPEFPVCFDIVPDALTTDVRSLQLNYASSVVIGGSSDALARTSVASWSDTDGDRMQDPDEPSGPFVVLAKEHLGSGEIVLLSDPSVLINGMQAQLDNGLLASNLLAVVSDGRAGLHFDESHREYFDPVAIGVEVTGAVPGNVKAALFALVFVLALWVATDFVDRAWAWFRGSARSLFAFASGRLLGRGKREHEEPSIDELVRELSEAHPEWRAGLVRYVVSEKRRHDAYVDRRA
ncbi:MAG: hypothetical protein JSV90_00115 [Methanobacteriota archaeon]|nr:MAG: hypothetical protein JSV90_00115 [Euryarchaeota archaeon]